MPLFTISLEFRGGTYLDQVKAADERKALKVWAGALETNGINGLSTNRKAKLVQVIDEQFKEGDYPCAISGLVNVWFHHCNVGGPMFIDIVKTSPQ